MVASQHLLSDQKDCGRTPTDTDVSPPGTFDERPPNNSRELPMNVVYTKRRDPQSDPPCFVVVSPVLSKKKKRSSKARPPYA